MLKKHLQFKGFSMIEALVAITVLTIGVIGPLTLLAGAIANANYARNQITAFFLAQEGQELVINHRNNNRLSDKSSGDPNAVDTNGNSIYWLAGNGFRNCITRFPNNPNGDSCYVDAYKQISSGDNFTPCSNGVCPSLDLVEDDLGYHYGYDDSPDNNTKTIFSRKIRVIPCNVYTANPCAADNESDALVEITVSWQEKNLSRNFTLQSIIYR